MKTTKIPTILALTVMLSLLSSANGAQYLTVNGEDVKAATVEVGKLYSVEVASTDSTSYVAYVGFDNGIVLGDFSHLQTEPEAGNLAGVGQYDQAAFYGYYLSAAGFGPPPSAATHFVFQYQPQQIGETDIKLYDQSFGSAIDSVHLTVIRPTMGTAFTYQGRLMDENEAADGLYDFLFELYDSESEGGQLGPAIDMDDLDVVDGQFAVTLDFGADIFDGNAVWLETTVAHADGSDPCTLTPRVELTPTPYALYAASAGVSVPLRLNGSSGSPIISGTNTSDYGIAVSGEALGDYAVAVHGNSTGIQGHGGLFRAEGSNGNGVHGHSVSSNGVYGSSNRGDGVRGTAWSGSLTGRGVYGEALGAKGTGVYGEASDDSSSNYGGYFVAAGVSGQGVHAHTTGSSGTAVHAIAFGENGTAVYGEVVSTNPGNYAAVRGVNNGTENKGMGVWGSQNGNGTGVYGTASGETGRGVYGLSGGIQGQGVYGRAAGASGTGVVGYGGKSDFCALGPGVNYDSCSSGRWKSNIHPIEDPLAKILNLRGVYFDWDAEHGGQHDMGMIAEEVGQILPEIVTYEENGIDARGMDYSKLTPLLVEAVKTLKTEVDEFRLKKNAEIAAQQTQISELQKERSEKDLKIGGQERQIQDLQKEVAKLKDMVMKAIERK